LLAAPLLLLLLWTKEVQNHESLVQDRKTKKLKSNGWQLIRQKFVTIFDLQKQNLFQQHPSIQFPFICFSSSSSSSCSPRLVVVVVVVVPVCLSVGPTEKKLRIFVKNYNRGHTTPITILMGSCLHNGPWQLGTENGML
jgi:hypothetical protein